MFSVRKLFGLLFVLCLSVPQLLYAQLPADSNTVLPVGPTSVTATDGLVVPITQVTAYRSAIVQIGGTFSGTITFWGSADCTTYVPIPALSIQATSGPGATTATTADSYIVQLTAKCFKATATVYNSGTITGTTIFFPKVAGTLAESSSQCTQPTLNGFILSSQGDPISGTTTFNGTPSPLSVVAGANGLAAAAGEVHAVAIGDSALASDLTGDNNAAVGYHALTLATGANNTALGSTACDSVTSGANNVCLGKGADVPSATSSYQFNLADSIFGNLVGTGSQAGIRWGSSTIQTGVSLDWSSKTDSMLPPTGTTGQRPGTPIEGMFRANTTTHAPDYYNGTTWTSLGTGSGSVTSVTFTGDGTVLSSTPSSAVTTTGTLTAALATAAAKTVLGNATASTAAPTYTTAPVVSGLSTALDFNATATGTTSQYQIGGNNALWQDSTNLNTVGGNTAAPTTLSQAGGGSNGTNQTAFGASALNAATTGRDNTAVGADAGAAIVTGIKLTAFGSQALDAATGDTNAAFGYTACHAVTTGISNLCLGTAVGSTTPTTGGANILIGVSGAIQAGSSSGSNLIKIGGTGGAWLDASGSSTITTMTTNAHGIWQMPDLSTNTGATTGTVCWTTSTGNLRVNNSSSCTVSLEEWKNIQWTHEMNGLDIVMRLRPFWFKWREKNLKKGDPYEQPGFGAHATEAVDKRLVSYDGSGKLQTVRYQEMAAVLVKAIQEQQVQIDDLKRQLGRR